MGFRYLLAAGPGAATQRSNAVPPRPRVQVAGPLHSHFKTTFDGLGPVTFLSKGKVRQRKVRKGKEMQGKAEKGKERHGNERKRKERKLFFASSCFFFFVLSSRSLVFFLLYPSHPKRNGNERKGKEMEENRIE